MRVSHGQVQWRIILEILRVHINAPRLQVVRRRVRACDARPMQWFAPFSVFGHDREALCPEVSQAVSLVTLCRNMKHVEAKEILSVFVRTILHQCVNCIHISFKGCKVQRGELVLHCSRVNPCPDIMIFSFLNLFR